MQGQRGASLATTRRIHRRMRREYERMLGLLAEKRKRPGYCEERCLTAETVRLLERQLSGESMPVGVLPGHWRTVCLENPSEREVTPREARREPATVHPALAARPRLIPPA